MRRRVPETRGGRFTPQEPVNDVPQGHRPTTRAAAALRAPLMPGVRRTNRTRADRVTDWAPICRSRDDRHGELGEDHDG